MATLAGKVAIVTGASRGIGRGIALRLGREGASVVINYATNEVKAREVVHDIETSGGHAVAIQADMSQPGEVHRLFQESEEHFGSLDILVNNAAIGLLQPTIEVAEETFDSVFALNVKGTFLALQEATRRMRNGGRIISLSSGATVLTIPGFGVYAASKAAIEQFSLALSKELGSRGITVNTILPTLVDTETLVLSEEVVAHYVAQTPLGRLGKPEDIADLVAFLVSEQGSWVTGQALRAGGGLI